MRAEEHRLYPSKKVFVQNIPNITQTPGIATAAGPRTIWASYAREKSTITGEGTLYPGT